MAEHPTTGTQVATRRGRMEAEERPPIWRNTRPRGNAELDRHDLQRSIERLEMVLGR